MMIGFIRHLISTTVCNSDRPNGYFEEHFGIWKNWNQQCSSKWIRIAAHCYATEQGRSCVSFCLSNATSTSLLRHTQPKSTLSCRTDGSCAHYEASSPDQRCTYQRLWKYQSSTAWGMHSGHCGICAHLLINHCAVNVNAKGFLKFTTAHSVAQSSHTDSLLALFKFQCVDLSIRRFNETTTLTDTINSTRTESADILLRHIYFAPAFSKYRPRSAISRGNLATGTAYLFEKRTQINSVHTYRCTPFIPAVIMNHPAMIKLLLLC